MKMKFDNYKSKDPQEPDDISMEIGNIFADLNADDVLMVQHLMPEEWQGLNYRVSDGFYENLSDVFIDWYDVWAAQNNNGSVKEFLKKERLYDFVSEKQFIDLLGAEAFVPDEFLEVIRRKLPFKIYNFTLVGLNNRIKEAGGYCIDMSKQQIEDFLLKLKKSRKINTPKHDYYLQHKQEFYDRCVSWRAKNKEHLKEVLKQYRQTRAKEIAEIKSRYYKRNKETLLAKAQQWREENPEKVKENSHKNYVKNREKRMQQNKEWIKNNPEARKAQKQRYYEAHAEEVKARMVRNRNKKRFRTKTGVKILALLQGIVNSR